MSARNPCASASIEGLFTTSTTVALHTRARPAPFLTLTATAVGTFTSAAILDLSQCFLSPTNIGNSSSDFFNLRNVQHNKALEELGKMVLMLFRSFQKAK